jgi:hypothetical protein
MPTKGMRELVGRVMVDPEFLAELLRSPDANLAEYTLSDQERAAVMQALARLKATPPGQRARAFQSAIVRRVAT